MRFMQNKIIFAASGPSFNPMQGLETPDEASFATSLPNSQVDIDTGKTQPIGHKFDSQSHGISKRDSSSHVFEPLAYHLGKDLGVNIPTTVARQFPNEKGKKQGYSVQRRVDGHTMAQLTPQDRTKALNHPDFHKSTIFRWLDGDDDGHDGNFIYDQFANNGQGAVHTIDNGRAFGYHLREPKWKQNAQGHITTPAENTNTEGNFLDGGLDHPVPADMRQRIIDADPEHHRQLMERFFNHPSFPRAIANERSILKKDGYSPGGYYENMTPDQIKSYMMNQYMQRLNTLKHHMGDPQVQTMGDLHSRLFHPV